MAKNRIFEVTHLEPHNDGFTYQVQTNGGVVLGWTRQKTKTEAQRFLKQMGEAYTTRNKSIAASRAGVMS